jgi:signal transduction histidine kinase
VEWSEELTGGLLHAVPDAILVLDGARIVLANDRAEELSGYPRAELIGRQIHTLFDEARTVVRRRDGREVPAESSEAVVETPEGQRTIAVIRALSDREAHVHRSRRLESLGQLAGGIAHDFNNMLGVIVNYATFVIEEAESEAPDLKMIAADARQVVRAGERGTNLTQQLLAFARRGVVRPQLLDLNTAITDVEEMLRRSIGEHITLIFRPDPGLPAVTWDLGQVEQLLVTLAVNARDAMPAGGNLVIDTGRHGDRVRLRVSDSGRGMAPEVVERAFEPFFTTKASGEATGLGLATVYGIVTQAGGDVSIASSPGLGTTVTVLLPITGDATDAAAPSAPAPTEAQGETLLVVEDESALREVAGRILSGAGYHVLTAECGAEALELAARHEGPIDLLVSDVVMPGMLGKEVAERLTSARPVTRVLYMSGYAQPVLHSQGTLDPGVALLEKPFTADELLAAVRKRLDD